MSSGQYRLIRDLGPVKGGKGLRHHEVVLTLSWQGVISFLVAAVRGIVTALSSPQSRPKLRV